MQDDRALSPGSASVATFAGPHIRSLAAVLDRVRDSLSNHLLGAEGYAALAAVASSLPEEITTFWGLECRLGDQAARADLLLETRRDSRGQELLAGGSQLDPLCRASPTWAAVRRFSRAWSEAERPFAPFVRNLWLEFDTAATASREAARQALLSPCVFLGPSPGNLAAAELAGLLADALPLLHPTGSPVDLAPLSRMPLAGGCLFQVGLMLSRSDLGCRLCFRDLSLDDVPAWLTSGGWRGDEPSLRRVVRTLAPLTRSVAVDLSVSAAGLDERIGLECYMEWLKDDPQQWVPLLDQLEAERLLLPAKREGLLAFPGVTPFAREERHSAGVTYTNLFRRIHHLKLTVGAAGIEQAKAYLALSRPALRWTEAESRSGWFVE